MPAPIVFEVFPDLPGPGRAVSRDRPALFGILNVTPDSFSDGGRYLDPQRAVAQGLRLLEDGADVIDIGGESTRPGAAEVPIDLEIERVTPVIAELKRQCPQALISIDTRKRAVAESAFAAGASILNDVSGLRFDPAMAVFAAERDCPVVLMHMRGVPATMNRDIAFSDVVAEVRAELLALAEDATGRGLRRERLILDPGIGFGKTPRQNFRLLAHLDALVDAGYPVMVGVSRKSLIGKTTGASENERLAGTIALESLAFLRGALIFRTHEPAATRQALAVTRAWLQG